MSTIPFIDIFAGPGGLSEGFSRFASFTGASTGFESQLAIEKDPIAVQTLRLRSFYRQFPEGAAPDEFYDVIRGQRAIGSLALFPEWGAAEHHVWNATLGEVDERLLHDRIAAVLGHNRNWVLLGGPPCQAYSLMGRARMTGIGTAARENGNGLDDLREAKLTSFAADHRHRLYREYLRIVAAHEPAVFVMENVKGIISSKLAGEHGSGFAFDRIREDLSDPRTALQNDPSSSEAVRRSSGRTYRLYSLVVGGDRSDYELKSPEFVIKAENFGVPQRRHRVILLGVRDDVPAQPAALASKASASVKEALAELPALRSGITKEKVPWAEWQSTIRQEVDRAWQSIPAAIQEAINAALNGGARVERGFAFARCESQRPNSPLAQWYHDERIGGVIQHESRSHMRSDLGRYVFAAATAQVTRHSPKLQDWPASLLPDHKNVTHDPATGCTVATGFSDRFKVQLWVEPSSTITSHIAKDGHYFIHPDPRDL
jgi:DNA (cytosine-5)-methyltransferase 1